MASDYTNPPGPDDVEILLRSTAYWPTDSTAHQLARANALTTVEAAYSEFETRTGWIPFLAQGTYAAPFDGVDHTGYLEFEGGALSIESVSVRGRLLPANNWAAQPTTAPRRRRPYTALQLGSGYGAGSWWDGDAFLGGGQGGLGSIEVRAEWGFCHIMPADAWLAVMRLAAAQTLSQIENAQGVAQLSQAGFSKAFDVTGVITQASLLDVLSRRFDAACLTYRREAG